MKILPSFGQPVFKVASIFLLKFKPPKISLQSKKVKHQGTSPENVALKNIVQNRLNFRMSYSLVLRHICFVHLQL